MTELWSQPTVEKNMARIKKLYFVKREVVANSLREAMKTKGVIYEVSLADEKLWPENKAKLGYGEKEKTN